MALHGVTWRYTVLRGVTWRYMGRDMVLQVTWATTWCYKLHGGVAWCYMVLHGVVLVGGVQVVRHFFQRGDMDPDRAAMDDNDDAAIDDSVLAKVFGGR
eukprot:5831445-Pyramimonas_sp.AAC.1